MLIKNGVVVDVFIVCYVLNILIIEKCGILFNGEILKWI